MAPGVMTRFKRMDELKRRIENILDDIPKTTETFVQWCDKYGCAAPNGCGNCQRQYSGCHTIFVKVKKEIKNEI